jgi:hypothetical protein
MKKLLFLTLACTVFAQCKKDDEVPNFIKAGESKGNVLYTLNFVDSIEAPVWHEYTDAFFRSSPVNIDNDDDYDVRVAVGRNTYNDTTISLDIMLGYNGTNCDFAIGSDDYYIEEFDTLKFIKLFNVGAEINQNQRWLQGDNSHLFFISIYYNYNGIYLSRNENISYKYIGIRKLIGSSYRYGWIKINVADLKQVSLEESCFTN